ncbi:cuticle protein 21-like [Phymastichus coffea]|uniref:cuticle protein 21-like n=1 Tax=Phymastichus coffea TaxID=108790 RepID=UPI00273B50F9|nr:cuticle protein 21-like [Phymastichus coffea]
MLFPKAVFVFLLNGISLSEVLSQYGYKSERINNDLCNTKALHENYRDAIIVCISSPKPKVQKVASAYGARYYASQKASNSYVVPATVIADKPRSFIATQHEISNKDAEFTIYPKYSYNYGVLDGNTGDTKAAWEERDGDTVRGEYSVVEADGSIRTVTYTADDQHGFNAVVTRTKPMTIVAQSAIVKNFSPFSIYNRARPRP